MEVYSGTVETHSELCGGSSWRSVDSLWTMEVHIGGAEANTASMEAFLEVIETQPGVENPYP
jgi:hypothetical protein